MTTYISSDTSDDARFIEILEQVLTGLIEWQAPEELYIIQINNWFDHKWLNYSGKGIVPFDNCGIKSITPVSLDGDFRRDKRVFPPFSPNRVLWEEHFKLTPTGYAEQVPLKRHVHKRVLEHANQNFQRRVADFSPSAVFLWYSSNTATNEFGSLMTYMVCNKAVETWYASLKKQPSWRLRQTKGIAQERLQVLFPSESVWTV